MNKRVKLLLVFIVLILPLIYWLGLDFSRTSSTLYINADVLALAEKPIEGDAIFVQNGLIQSIGSTKSLLEQRTPKTKVVDLSGSTIMPGFIDSHTHPALAAFFSEMIDLSGFSHATNSEVWVSLQLAVQNAKPGEWLICKGLDPVLTHDLITPSRVFLDSIAPNNPVFIISQSIHSYWANTAAFSEVGIDKNTPNPSKSSYYEKDTSGELSGFIAEQEALIPFRNKITEIYGTQLIDQTINTLKGYAANGNTTIVAMGLTAYEQTIVDFYKYLSSRDPGFLSLVLSKLGILPKRGPAVRHFVYIRHDASELLPEVTNGDDFFKVIGVKFWYDGAPYTGSMYLDEPYLNSEFNHQKLHIGHDHRGESLIDPNELAEEINAYEDEGWQVAVHSQGDRSTKEVMYAFAKGSDAANDNRHRIEHCLLIQTEALRQMSSLGIHPSFHINHLYYYGQTLQSQIIGAERAEQILPIQIADSLELRYTLHADAPMFPSEPLSLIQTAVTRKTKEGNQIGLPYRIGIDAALRAMTIEAAWQIKMEDKLGTIEVGKYADFVVLDKNPLKCNPEDFRTIKVNRTIVAGEDVYIRPE